MSKDDIVKHQFKPGQSGNPSGKPKGIPNSKTRYQRMLVFVEKAKNPSTGELEDFTYLEIMDMKIMEKAKNGDLAAYRELLDRLEGKPAPTNEVAGELNVKFEVVNKVPDAKELPPKT